MATTGESGNGPANNVGPVGSGYPKFRLLLLLATTATMAAVLLLVVATAAAVIPLNFAATACSADHISLFSVYYFFTVISNFDEQQILPQIFSSVHSFFSALPFLSVVLLLLLPTPKFPSRNRTNSTHYSSGAPANSAVLH